MRTERQGDEGFGLIEIMVAMIVLAVIMVAMLSVILSGLRSTAKAATLATATELVQQRLEQARAIATEDDPGLDKCPALIASVTAVGPVVDDGRGVPITVAGTISGSCDSAVDSDPVITMTATTTSASFSNPLAETVTKIYVKGAAP